MKRFQVCINNCLSGVPQTVGLIIVPWHRACCFWNIRILQNMKSCPLSVCVCVHICFQWMYLLMDTVCHEYIFLALEVSVHSGSFSPLVCIPGIQRGFGVPVLLAASQLLRFVVLLINNYIMYCCTILDPWHTNSVLIYCDLGYIFHRLGSAFTFQCLSVHLNFGNPLTSGAYLQFLSREYYTVLSNFFFASKLGTKTSSDIFKFILLAGN